VEPPDQIADELLGGPMPVGEGVQLVHQPFRVDPAQRVPADRERSRVVAQDDAIIRAPGRYPIARPRSRFVRDPA
jgi:hypothetical protein